MAVIKKWVKVKGFELNKRSIGLNLVNRYSANPAKWSNTLKQFVGLIRIVWVCWTILYGLRLKGC